MIGRKTSSLGQRLRRLGAPKNFSESLHDLFLSATVSPFVLSASLLMQA
jgi:hypothetical protein